jgi:hypothetical protein
VGNRPALFWVDRERAYLLQSHLRHSSANRLQLYAKDFNLSLFLAVNVTVTILVLILGVVAFVCGIRKRYPKYGAFLGHTRFSNYFMITIFPMQSGFLPWSWDRFIAILAFAVPTWMLFHFGLMPLRK